ncbi:MAG: N-acetylmuramoyl-L-alanine amidase-like domain-containing protein [Ignavibacteriaceae bacterium]
MKTRIAFLLSLIFAVSASFGQTYTEEDISICKSKFQLAVDKNKTDAPIGDVIAFIGRSFLGVNYVAHTLEKGDEENLVINLTGLDCTTFLENCLTFGRLVKANKTEFADYMKELTYIRYRDGVLDKYPSRLHYFSDWIRNNTSKGIVTDITQSIGGKEIKFNIFFMSQNPDKYRQLNENPDFIPEIKAVEEEINNKTYYYIPKEEVKNIESKIQNGDLIAITTNLKGLDIGHVGVAVKEKTGRIHFMHAPLVGSKVQISEDPLPDYLAKIKKHTGIIVLRPTDIK